MYISQNPYYQYKPITPAFKGLETYGRDSYGSSSQPSRTYSVPPELWRSAYGFKFPVSEEMKKYDGELGTDAGYSTKAGGYGGSWLLDDINVPLSTKDVHDCALVNLVNTETDEQLLYHVYSKTGSASIERFIKNMFPRFDLVNIMPGDQFQTKLTVGKILTAIDNINPQAEKKYYHAPVENPEIVAVNGKLEYIESDKNSMSFRIMENYNY